MTGPFRAPVQMLARQVYDDHASIHDDETASSLGLAGAPIEGPTHFSQFDPLAYALWKDSWFERGCISTRFRNMVVEGEQVRAAVWVSPGASLGAIRAVKPDDQLVLEGTASIGDGGPSALERRLGEARETGTLHILDRLEVGARVDVGHVSLEHSEPNGQLYPFSLAEKLQHITEPNTWYTPDGADPSPWGRQIVPFEMVSVLVAKVGQQFPVRTPSTGVFQDLEVRMHAGPVFVGESYALTQEIVGLDQTRRVESYWIRSELHELFTGKLVASVLLHGGLFKESYPGYPRDE